MYYPVSLRIWRQQEELGGLLDVWISRVQRGETLASGLPSLPKRTAESGGGGVDTWKRSAAFAPQKAPSSTNDNESEDAPPPILLGSGGSARYEMLLERLPYLTRILRKSRMPSPATAATIREIQRITSFTGSSMTTALDDDQDDDEDETVEQEQWTTDRPAPDIPRKKTKNRIEGKKSVAEEALAGIVEKDVGNLVLSDDDIED